jgi:NAD(P)-dependent dehydrogenase (short-subunit alcohol dehydrogenase family)
MEDSRYGDAAFVRYVLSKLANLLFARQLQKKFDAEGVKALAISLHPGLVKTSTVLIPPPQYLLQGLLLISTKMGLSSSSALSGSTCSKAR